MRVARNTTLVTSVNMHTRFESSVEEYRKIAEVLIVNCYLSPLGNHESFSFIIQRLLYITVNQLPNNVMS